MVKGLSFRNIDEVFAFAKQVLREVVDETPVEVLVHIAEAVALLWEHEHIETLAGTDESIDNADCIAWVYVVVDVAVDKEEMTLEIFSD